MEWQNLGFLTKFLMKSALFDKRKLHFWWQNRLECESTQSYNDDD